MAVKISLSLTPQNYVFVPTESVSVSKKVRFGPFRSISVPRESVSVSTKVCFGPFRYMTVCFGILSFCMYFPSVSKAHHHTV